MSYSYALHEKAQQDYETAVKWYAARSIKTAENFIIEVESVLELICANPYRWRNEYRNFRELGVKKYPYVIIYTVEEERQLVMITGIFHTSRNPKKKYRRRK